LRVHVHFIHGQLRLLAFDQSSPFITKLHLYRSVAKSALHFLPGTREIGCSALLDPASGQSLHIPLKPRHRLAAICDEFFFLPSIRPLPFCTEPPSGFLAPANGDTPIFPCAPFFLFEGALFPQRPLVRALPHGPPISEGPEPLSFFVSARNAGSVNGPCA